MFDAPPGGCHQGGVVSPADHVTVALSHLDRDDLGGAQSRLRRILASPPCSSDPVVARLVTALLEVVVAELARRHDDEVPAPGEVGPYA